MKITGKNMECKKGKEYEVVYHKKDGILEIAYKKMI